MKEKKMNKENTSVIDKTKKKFRMSLEKKEAVNGYFFILPWIIGLVLFTLVPLAQSFYYMWYNIRITPLGMTMKFVGIQNFTQIWGENPEFPQQLVTYIAETIIQVPIIVVFALIIAIMLNGKIHLRGFFRLIFFLPVIVVSGPVMNMLSDMDAASIPAMNVQSIVAALSLVFPATIATEIGEVFSNMIMILWYSGVQILIFISALQKIDPALYEAAKIDGGSGWECFWKITLPTLKPMILVNTIYTIIFSSCNEQNSLITMIESAMFSGTKEKGYGYASAMAWMYSVVIVLIVLLFYLILGNKKDVYDRQAKKHRREVEKQHRLQIRIRRRSARNAKKRERNKRKYTTYSGESDY